MSSKSTIACHWYQKTTDTGIRLNFCSCAPPQQKGNVIQGAIRRVFNATINSLDFDQAPEKNKTCWTKNQYPNERCSKIANRTIRKKKIISGSKDHSKTKTKNSFKNARLGLIINQLFLYNTEATLLQICKQIEENMRLASGFHNAEINISSHPEFIFR